MLGILAKVHLTKTSLTFQLLQNVRVQESIFCVLVRVDHTLDKITEG
jgi:hypothetical protein